jgi:hypothetical protein
MTNDIIDFMRHYKEKLKGVKKEIDNEYSKAFQQISKELIQSEKEIKRMALLYSFAKYSLFLNCLFYNNHNSNNDIKTGFLIGYKEEHLNEIENSVCNILDKLDRPYRFVNARAKSIIAIFEELTNSYFNSKHQAKDEIERQFFRSENVYIIREFSDAKIESKEYSLRGLIKLREKTNFINDKQCETIHPDSDLIFIDYANFLQKAWDKIGYYLSILSYSEDEKEINFDFKE